jgi:hypothetical protein
VGATDNFQAPYYSVFSDNRPELAIPTFHTVENFIDLGKWRASMRYWGAGGHPEAPGFWTQDFNHMALLRNNRTLEMINGTRWFKAGFRGINFPTHISPAKRELLDLWLIQRLTWSCPTSNHLPLISVCGLHARV